MKVKYFIINKDDKEECIVVSREEAIRQQREYYLRFKPNFTYANDEEALRDFLGRNFASIIDG